MASWLYFTGIPGLSYLPVLRTCQASFPIFSASQNQGVPVRYLHDRFWPFCNGFTVVAIIFQTFLLTY